MRIIHNQDINVLNLVVAAKMFMCVGVSCYFLIFRYSESFREINYLITQSKDTQLRKNF